MNNYSDATLTIDDLTSDVNTHGYKDERGSTFTNCTFEETAGGDTIDDVDFDYGLFTNCTWNVKTNNCGFKAAEGDVPAKTVITFVVAPPEGQGFQDELNALFQGDGETTEFTVKRNNEATLREAIEVHELTDPEDYSIVMGQVSMHCNLDAGFQTRAEYLALFELEASTDATDTYDPYDGVPDIPADGVSTCTITVKKKDLAGNYLTGAGDDDTVEFDTSRGALSDLRKDMVNGEVSVTLRSVQETCVATVTANIEGASCSIMIQFAPVV